MLGADELPGYNQVAVSDFVALAYIYIIQRNKF